MYVCMYVNQLIRRCSLLDLALFVYTAPTSGPLNVIAFLNNSGSIIVTWEPVPVEHRLGAIQGYKVIYTAQSTGQQKVLTVNRHVLSTELPNLLIYTLYNIQVLAFNSAGESPTSLTLAVRSAEDGKKIENLLVY